MANFYFYLGLYDELAMFLSQINVFRSKGLSDSHEMAVFLQLYGVLVPGYEEQVCNSTLLCGCLQSMVCLCTKV